MKCNLELHDIQPIVSAIIEGLKPYLSCKSENRIDDTTLDVPGLCEYLHVSNKWVYKRTHLKEIPHYKAEGVLLFKKHEIDKWLSGYRIPLMNRMSGNLRQKNDK
jgi:excisionase family DNA binding protein